MRLALQLGVAVLLACAQPACSCNTKSERCPAAFTVGERCPFEGLVCEWPESRCNATSCTCVNQPGGFYWKCQSQWCACTCPCGYTARTSCETLSCSKAEDPCPAEAADVCAVACTDSRVRDAGRPEWRIDARPLPDGPPRDGARDRPGDTGPDRAIDLEVAKPRSDLAE